MRSLSTTLAHRESPAARIWQAALAAMKSWLAAQAQRRAEHAAIAQLKGMSDRELSDIGITRAEIEFAVNRGTRDSRAGSSGGISG